MDKCADYWFGNSDTIAHIWLTLLPLAVGGFLGYQLFMLGMKIYFKIALVPVEATISKIEDIEGEWNVIKITYRYEYQGKKYKVCERRKVDDRDEYKVRAKTKLKIYRREPGLFLDEQFKKISRGIAIGVGVIFAIIALVIASTVSSQLCGDVEYV